MTGPFSLLLLLALTAQVSEPGNLLWPFGDGYSACSLRATYGQAEGSGMHAGLDVMPKRKGQRVYALETGVVVRVETADPEAAGLVIESEDVAGRSFLYLHLQPDTIQFAVGDEVEVDSWLGNVVTTDTSTGKPHLHLSRLQGDTVNADWGHLGPLNVRNPLALIGRECLEDGEDPYIAPENETGVYNFEELAFRANEDGTDPKFYLPDQLPVGEIDVIARVHDSDGRSDPLAPHHLELSIRPRGMRGKMERWVLCLDGPLPMLDGAGGPMPDSLSFYNEEGLKTVGVHRDVPADEQAYYFILTNGGRNCSELASQDRAWKPSAGEYDLELVARDVGGRTVSSGTLHAIVK